MRAQDLLGAAFLYLVIAVGYGVWTATHDPRAVHSVAQLSPSFIRYCLSWPRMISTFMRASPINRAISSI